VKGVVTKVTGGEADWGSCTSPTSWQRATRLNRDHPGRHQRRRQIPRTSVKASTHAVDQAFIDYVLGPDGQQILAKYGFMAP
jgi:ABC-type molybdate transport system substrate-binding protein